MIPSNRKSSFPAIIAFTIILLMVSLTPISCGKELQLPEKWTRQTFKLLEHPEVFAGEKGLLERANNYVTLGGDTRNALRISSSGEFIFDVFLPLNGTIQFAYGYDHNLSQYSPEVILSIEVEDPEITHELASLSINTADQEKVNNWTETEFAIPENLTGPKRLKFSLSGFKENVTGGHLFIAHPCIVIPYKKATPKRVIWLSIDTLRPDHLGCYGYDRPTSPNIDAFAEESTVFERCISVCPWTFPSYAAMFTGTYPTISGATTNLFYLPLPNETLAEIISTADIATFSAHNVPWVGTVTGLHSGFDTAKLFAEPYDDVSLKYAQEWLTNHGDQDCFMFIHLFDPHIPYEPKDEHYGKFDPGYKGPYQRRVGGLEHVSEGKAKLPEHVRKHVVALYDEEILGCDEEIGNFLNFLRENDLYEDSLIIINSDHGEEFGEHGKYQHGRQLYDETLRVPLIIRGPGFPENKRVEQMCAAFDIFPTILEWLGIEVPSELNAISLSDCIEAKTEDTGRWVLSEQLYFNVEQKAVTNDEYRYIIHTLDGSEELYETATDPGMKTNVSSERRATSRNFRYFVTEYTLHEGTGWHVRISRAKAEWNGRAFYEGKIVAPSGFADIARSQLNNEDKLELNGNELTFHISIGKWNAKSFDFSTNDENDMVQFDVFSPNNPKPDEYIYLGAEKVSVPPSGFSISILDPLFGLGMPQFGQSPGHDGFHIWGNSVTLHEQVTPEIDDETKEALKSLGYLN